MHLSLGNIILLKEKGGMRESFPREVDKKSRGPPGERVWNSQGGRKNKLFSPLHSLGLYNNNVSCLRTVSVKKTSWLILLSQNVDYGSRSGEIFTTSRHSFDSL